MERYNLSQWRLNGEKKKDKKMQNSMEPEIEQLMTTHSHQNTLSCTERHISFRVCVYVLEVSPDIHSSVPLQ